MMDNLSHVVIPFTAVYEYNYGLCVYIIKEFRVQFEERYDISTPGHAGYVGLMPHAVCCRRGGAVPTTNNT